MKSPLGWSLRRHLVTWPSVLATIAATITAWNVVYANWPFPTRGQVQARFDLVDQVRAIDRIDRFTWEIGRLQYEIDRGAAEPVDLRRQILDRQREIASLRCIIRKNVGCGLR